MPAGRPTYKPTDDDRAIVNVMAAGGFRHERIAARLGMDDKTLRKHFRRELDIAMDMATAHAVSKLFEAVKDGAPWAICFWLKCRAGWREVERVEHVGGDGGPVKIIVEYEDRPAKAT
jgi:hypothetical protein